MLRLGSLHTLRGSARTVMTASESPQRLAFVSLKEGTERITVSFKFANENINDRLFTLDRNQHEALDISLNRLKTNIASRMIKKKKKKADTELPEVSVHVEDAKGNIMEPFHLNKEAFITGHTLVIDDKKLPIVVNAPTVSKLALPKIMLAGFPIVPHVNIQNGKIEESVFSWWRLAGRGTVFDILPKEDVVAVKALKFVRIPNETSNVYIPSEKDVGHKLMVSCEPRREDARGIEFSEFSSTVVGDAALKFPFEDRHEFTKEVLPDERFRVVSYNLLANIYAHTAHSKAVLFNYCPKRALDFDYRKLLHMKELMGYNADLISLQEVDRNMFNKELEPLLVPRGFGGIYSEKCGESPEGEALFYRKSKFDLIESHSINLATTIQENEALEEIRSAVNANEKLRLKLKQMNQVLQVLVLEHKATERRLIVCNTHLYFKPEADHIRLLQAFVSMKISEQLAEKFKQNDARCPLLFCGDFNSTPQFGVYQLFTTGKVGKDSEDWRSENDEKVSGLEAKIPWRMKSAYGTPPFTNYTVEFKDCLDYIFYSEELCVDSVVPLPSEEVLSENTAIPSSVVPSDHLALVADLRFK